MRRVRDGEPTSVGGNYATIGEFCVDRDGVNTSAVNTGSGTLARIVPDGQWQAVNISPDGARLARVDLGDGPIGSGSEEWFGPTPGTDVKSV